MERAPEEEIAAVEEVTSDGYVIGEEHPSVHQSDALFEARSALELGALELTINRLSSSQLAGYRVGGTHWAESSGAKWRDTATS